jgi:exonuclease SbcC
MILQNIFKPKWQHKKAQVRKKALLEMNPANEADLAAFIQVAREDEEPEVRRVAIKQLTDIDLLQEIADQDKDAVIREYTTLRFCNLLSGKESGGPGLDQRLQKLNEISDAKLLEIIARNAVEPQLRRAALQRVERESLLGDLAISDPDLNIRLEALDRISQQSTLERVFKRTRSKDKRVSARAKEKLIELIAEQERPTRLLQKGKQLCVELEALSKTKDWNLAQAKLKTLDADWQVIINEWDEQKDGPWDTELVTRFNKARELFISALEDYLNQEAEQRAIEAERDPIRAEKKALCENLEMLVSDIQQHKIPGPSDEESIKQTLSASKTSWDKSGQLPAAEQQSFAARFNTAYAQLQNFLQDIHRYDDAVKTLQSTLTRASKLLDQPKPIEEKELKNLDRRVKEILLPAHFSIEGELKQQVEEASRQLRDRRSRELDKRKENLEAVKKMTGELEQALQKGQSQHAFKLQKRIQKLLSNMPQADVNALRKQGIQRRFQTVSKQIEDLRDWKRWASTPLKEKLVNEMEALATDIKADPDQIYDYNNLAGQIKHARDEWKRLGETEPDSAQELWDRFNVACNEAYAPCEAYFHELAQQRKENLEKKRVICQELENFVNSADWENMDWKKADRIVRVAQDEWRAIGPVDRKERSVVDKQFRTVMKTLRERISEYRENNSNLKQSLVTQMEKLAQSVTGLAGDSPELLNTIEQVKQLQSRWKQIGMSSREKTLWKSFRKACDVIFAQRKAHFEAKDQERQANLQAKLALCETIESIARLQGDELKQSRGRFEQARRQWNHIGEVPKESEQGLSKRFQQACKQFDKAERSRLAAEQQFEIELIKQKSALCGQVESIIEKILANKLDIDTALENLQKAQQSWQTLQTLPDEFEQSIQIRFENGVDRIMKINREGTAAVAEELSKVQADNLEKKKLLCLRMEILAEVESPPEFRQARMEYQVSQLAEKMKQGDVLSRSEKRAADKKAAMQLFSDWSALGFVPADENALLENRFNNAMGMLDKKS